MTGALVAITASTKLSNGFSRVRLNEAYVNAVRGAGLIPLVLPPLPPSELEAVVGAVQGVVLSGGEDVDPSEYDAVTSPKTEEPHRARDRCELALVRMARERKLPTLAICRGMQVVNVALGGTLVQDIASECPNTLEHERGDERASRVHEIRAEPRSRLADALGAAHLTVNSSHHQALARVAEGLRVTARASDGIIEGAEWGGDDDWWMLAVQWHPEEMVFDAEDWDRSLFRSFAKRLGG